MAADLKAASLASYAGRGVIDPDDPLHLGSVLARPDSAEMIASSDCVLVVDSVLAEVDIWRDNPANDQFFSYVASMQDTQVVWGRKEA